MFSSQEDEQNAPFSPKYQEIRDLPLNFLVWDDVIIAAFKCPALKQFTYNTYLLTKSSVFTFPYSLVI
jgi:hypothetical protein